MPSGPARRPRCGCWTDCSPALGEPAGNRRAEEHQHQPAGRLAGAPGQPADAGTEFEAGQRHDHADGADHQSRHQDAPGDGSEREADHEVVQAQRERGDQEPHRGDRRTAARLGTAPARPGAPAAGLCTAAARPGAAATRLLRAARPHQAIRPDRQQQAAADPAGRAAERARRASPEYDSDHRHASLEQAERQPNPQPGARVHTCHADPERRSEVGEPERYRHDQQRKHTATVADVPAGTPARAAGPPAAGVPYAAAMRVALCQLPISSDPGVNLARAREALARAAASGARLAILPEGTLASFGSDLAAAAGSYAAFCEGLADAARAHGIAVVAGPVEPGPGRADGLVYNTAVAIDTDGRLAATYRKIHLFDALGQRESDRMAAGAEPVVVGLAGLRVGILICYDVRFPEHARALVDRGAELIAIPAAWAAGLFKEEHWVTLVRARAIENTVWVAAADQVPDPAESGSRAPSGVGRSMLVDPMGVVQLDLGPRAAVCAGELDPGLTAEVRAVLPSLEHRRKDVFG